MNAIHYKRLRLVALLGAGLSLSTSIIAAPPQVRVDPQGDAIIPTFTVPFSNYASPQARQMFQRVLEEGRHAPPLNGPIAASRAYYDKINTARAELLERLYPVKIRARTIGGVPT